MIDTPTATKPCARRRTAAAQEADPHMRARDAASLFRREREAMPAPTDAEMTTAAHEAAATLTGGDKFAVDADGRLMMHFGLSCKPGLPGRNSPLCGDPCPNPDRCRIDWAGGELYGAFAARQLRGCAHQAMIEALDVCLCCCTKRTAQRIDDEAKKLAADVLPHLPRLTAEHNLMASTQQAHSDATETRNRTRDILFA